MSSLNLSPDIQVLPCPACGQTINTSMQVCPFCAAPIDHAAAATSAESFGKLNQSISDASYVRTMALVAVGFYLTQFVPFLGILGFGFIFLEFAIPYMIIRWWTRYSGLKSPDPEYRSSRKTVLMVAASTLSVILVVNLVPFLLRR